MKVIEFEVKRSEHRDEELNQLSSKLESDLSVCKSERETVDKLTKQKEKEARKHQRVQKKQDRVLFVAFYILINL
eukprot:CAMPEP_0182421150 /NCGR_PEP_ID=MMETSP1167-20130531/6390_1 /TAXON_ID=2988 /ORGANISM="Mallomonas Sp, Strain CCMP3275" /LENGTH=74 /DNA_ID=CAMNT_0024597997 /DNA_START=351 /DNA_END=571 /DNA_ORIENTATION=-